MITEHDVKRFWRHVNKAESGCWLWTGWKWGSGYGAMVFLVDGVKKKRRVHRVAWEIFNGEIPRGMMVCHHCDTPHCVNPAHLFLGTSLENNRDKAAKGRSYRGGAHNPARGDANGSRKYPERLLRGDAWRELHKERRDGEFNWNSKLSWDKVRSMRTEYASGASYQSLCEKYGLAKASVWRVIANRVWVERHNE